MININPCLNCGGFNHNGYKCKNEPVSIKCNEKHSERDCRSNKIECVKCSYNNTKYRTSLPTDHLQTDRMNCSILKNTIKKYINSTDYPIAPTLPTWDETSTLKIIHNYQTNKLLYQRKGKLVPKLVKNLEAEFSPTPSPTQQQASTGR